MARLLILFALASPLLGMSPSANAQAPADTRPVLLDFAIPGCLPCRQMEPVVARLHQEGFHVRKVDASREPAAAQRFGVQLYPTFVVLSGGREVWRAQGPVAYEKLREVLVRSSPRQAPKPTASTGVVPATFNNPATHAPMPNAAFQVGSDLGPAKATTLGPTSGGPAPDRLLSASVRLRVEDASGRAFGTGTIIDTRQGEALVLTCAHLFRDMSDGTPVMVELFESTGGATRVVDRAPGRVIAVDMPNDVALISLKPNRPVRAVRVAASLGAVADGAPVWSVGCDLGADPTVRVSRVIGVNRTHRPPNVSTTGAPVQGRSGGGLFNAAGELVGVCFGADNQRDEGLYADLVSIHAQLDQYGLTEIYRGNPGPPAALVASTQDTGSAARLQTATVTPAAQPPVSQQPASQPLVAVPPPIVRAQDSPPLPSGADGLASLNDRERASLDEITGYAAEAEVICIIRPKSPNGRSEVISLDGASPRFVQALQTLGGGSTASFGGF